MLKYCYLLSLRHVTLSSRSGRRAYSACSSASSMKSVRMEPLTRQPTMRRVNTSMTKATYSQPCQAEMYVKFEAHNWFARSARNCRLTQPRGCGTLASLMVVRTALPRITSPHPPAQPHPAHQALDCAAGRSHALASQLPPYLVGAVYLHVDLPHALNLRHQQLFAFGAGTAPVGFAQQRGMA